MLDPRANRPDANLIAVQNTIEHDFEKLMSTNYGSTEIDRYSKELRSNHCHFIGKSKRTDKVDVGTASEAPCELFSEVMASWKKGDDLGRQMLALARLKSMPIDQSTHKSLSKLMNKANKCFQSGHFVNAIRNFNHAISIYLADRPISRMECQDKTKLAKLYAKRAQSNLSLGKEKRSPTIVQKVKINLLKETCEL